MKGKLVASAISLLVVINLGGNIFAQEGEKVKAGYQRIATGLPFFVALERGFFQDKGLEVEPIIFGSSNLLFEAAASGKIDATSDGGTFTFLSLEAAEPGLVKMYKMALVGTDVWQGEFGRYGAESIVVKKDSEIKSISDLKGKVVGIFPGIAIRTNLKLILAEFDLDIDKDLEAIELPPPLQLEALSAGRVDALYALDPVPVLAKAKGIGKSIADNLVVEYVMDPVSIGCGAFSTRFLKKRPAAARKFQQAMNRAVEWIYDNPQEALKIFPKYVPIDEEIVLKNRNANWRIELGEEDVMLLQENIDFWVKQGVLSTRLEAADLLVTEDDFKK